MPQPTRSPAASASTGPTCSPASDTGRQRRLTEGRRRALWYLGRMLVVGGLFAWAAGPLGTVRPTAFAEPSEQQWMTPTPTPYGWYSPQQTGVYTLTPTPYGYVAPPQNGEYINGGAVNQPGQTYTDPNNPYQNNPYQSNPYQNNPYQQNPYQPGGPPPGGVPGSSIQPNGALPGMMPGA